jgi:hypothetical protein
MLYMPRLRAEPSFLQPPGAIFFNSFDFRK